MPQRKLKPQNVGQHGVTYRESTTHDAGFQEKDKSLFKEN